ncbi:hypothetical protein HHK36_028856 [Tetracentron sinense]|uniref:Uncharacterized protein n=1 Tax=Tetracentron sinense TaxID=13715 RepID=A0A835D308_TETSI|nr:hypothetical protein HHK36_028856 [Tetracentron sinense]
MQPEQNLMVLYLNKAEASDKICMAIEYGSKFLSNGEPSENCQFVNDWHALIKSNSLRNSSSTRFTGKGRYGTKVDLYNVVFLLFSSLERLSASMKKLGKDLKNTDKYQNDQYCSKLKKSNDCSLALVKAVMDMVIAVGLLQLAPKKVTPRITGGFGFVSSLISCYQLLPSPPKNKRP